MSKKTKKLDYFDEFERQAELAVKEAGIMIDAIENFHPNRVGHMLKKAHEVEHEGDMVCHSIYTAIATDFITPIEREDIVTLAQSLDDIMDYIEDVLQRFYMYDITEIHVNTLEFARIIEKGCVAIQSAMADFRDFKKSKNFTERLIEINSLEEEADEFYIEIVRDMHKKDKDDPFQIMVWSQIYSRMERCTDACEHVADIMRTIMLKNS